MDKRYGFQATCPCCKENTTWLFSADKIGLNFVDCEHCGKPYVVSIKLVPETTCVYTLVKM